MGIPDSVNDIVLQIYSVEYTMRCSIVSREAGKIGVTPLINKFDMFLFNDPVVCIYREGSTLTVLSGLVCSLDYENRVAVIELHDERANQEKRMSERYPVSLSVDIRAKYSNKRHKFFARNISVYGLAAFSEVELNVGDSIDIDVFMEKNMFFFNGTVMWRKDVKDFHEYGMQLFHTDINSRNSFESYLNKINEVYMHMYDKART